MAYTARELITNSYYLSGIVSRLTQTVSGDQLKDGLRLLNALLAVKTAHSKLIPYFEKYNLTAVVGQEKYHIDNLILPQTFTFYIGTVRFSSTPKSRDGYFGEGRPTVQSLPYSYRFERSLGGMDLYLYFIPNTTYPLEIFGKFGLDEIANENVDLSASYDLYYIEYLRYALAEYLCGDYNIQMNPQNAQKLKELENIVRDISPIDLSCRKISSFGGGRSNDVWSAATLGRGWEA